MPIAAGGILVAATATTRCLSSVAGMLRFLARLSGRRRHVRRFKSSAPPTSPPPLPAAAPASTTSSGSSGPGGGGGGGGGAAFASSAAGQPQTPVAMEREQQLLGQQQERRRSRSKEDDNPSDDRPLAVHYCARCRCQYCSCAFLGLDDNVVDHDDDNDHDDDDGDVDEGRRHRPYLYGEGESENDGRKQRYREGGTSWLQHKDGRDSSTTSTESCTDRDVLRRRPPEIQRERTIPSTTSVGCARSGLGAIIPPYLATLLILSYSIIGMADACSSRSTPKPRPPTPTPRPNITFHMYTCPTYYAEWYCLNGATCFTVKIVDSLLYNCLCANGYIGQRCEFKDLDGSYLPSRQRVMLETASIAGAVTIAVFLIVIAFISVYIHCKRKQKELRTSSVDAVDGPGRDPELRPFCSRSRSLMTFMAKNPNSSTMPSIEQTRMPNWNYSAESSTRMASVNENKRSSQ